MVTHWILSAIGGLVTLLFAGLPSFTIPSWMSSGPTFVTSALASASNMGAWFPLTAIGLGCSAILACWSFTLALRVLRIGLSLVTGGGGGAA